MNFYKLYQILNENVEENFDKWLEMLIKYSKPDEKEKLDFLYDERLHRDPFSLRASKLRHQKAKTEIINILKEQNLENFNWFSFCIGYYAVKAVFRKEDLEMAITATKKAIDSGELPKTEIGAKGWFKIGTEAIERVRNYLAVQNQLSKREALKRKKRGEAKLDNRLVEVVVDEKEYKIYYLPKITTAYSHPSLKVNSIPSTDDVKQRHEILCKLGKDTEWCTAQPSWDAHERYVNDDIYTIHQKINQDEVPIYQFVGCPSDNFQFMDINDDDVEYLPKKVYDLLKKHLSKEIGCYNLKTAIENAYDFLNRELKNLDGVRTSDIETLFRKNNEQTKSKIIDKIIEYVKYKNLQPTLHYDLIDWTREVQRIIRRNYTSPEVKNVLTVFENLINTMHRRWRDEDPNSDTYWAADYQN